MSQLSRSQSSFVPNGSSRCLWVPVAPLTSTPVIGFAPPNVVLARDFFRVGLPAGDWSACDYECTPCDSMGQGGTQLVGARHSFGRHQNCTSFVSELRPSSGVMTRSTPAAYSRVTKNHFLLDKLLALSMLFRKWDGQFIGAIERVRRAFVRTGVNPSNARHPGQPGSRQ